MSDHGGIEDYDPHEYAKELEYARELSRSDLSERQPVAESNGLSRRDLLVRGGVGAAALAGAGALAGRAESATKKAGKFTGTLRVISLGVEWDAGGTAQAQAEKDLGFKFNVQFMSSSAQVQKAITDPESFDVGGLYNYQYMQIWPTGNMAPVDRNKITAWNGFYPQFTRGKININNKNCTYGQGNAPFRATFVDPDGSTGLPTHPETPKSNKQIVQWIDEKTGKPYAGKAQPRWIIGPPAHFNYDSLGYDADVIQKEPGDVSWAELLNAKWKGRVAVLSDPGIIHADLGNAVQAAGLMKFNNIGNMSRKELDLLFKIATKYKKDGHFRAFWSTFNESTNFMASKEVVIESMWSPALALLVAQGVNCRYAFPKEGMRGWCSAQGIPTHVTKDPEKLQAVYDYLNWMHKGWLGAFLMRQGYYMANGSSLQKWLRSPEATAHAVKFSPEEYSFWYGGAPAPRDLPGITGQVGDIKKGQIRDGGSLAKRSCKISNWNSFFVENTYQVKKVNEFLSS